MSLLSQLAEALADGTIQKGKTSVKTPKRKSKRPAGSLPHIKGEKHPFIPRSIQPCPPTPKPSFYMERKVIAHGRFVLPILVHYMPEELALATYHPFDFLGCSPIFPCHLTLPRNSL